MEREGSSYLILECLILFFPVFIFVFDLIKVLVYSFLSLNSTNSMWATMGIVMSAISLILLSLIYIVFRGIFSLLLIALHRDATTLGPLSIKIRVATGVLVFTTIFIFEWLNDQLEVWNTITYVLPMVCICHLLWLGRFYLFKNG